MRNTIVRYRNQGDHRQEFIVNEIADMTLQVVNVGIILRFSRQTEVFVPWHKVDSIENYSANGAHPLIKIMEGV